MELGALASALAAAAAAATAAPATAIADWPVQAKNERTDSDFFFFCFSSFVRRPSPSSFIIAFC